MAKWPWIERTFSFDFPPAKLPELIERLRGTPARVAVLIEGLAPELLARRDGHGWTIQENIGHLIDLGGLPRQRIREILAGKSVLVAADMKNRRTNEAGHNDRNIDELLAEFRRERADLVQQLEAVGEADWGRSALHPRLKQPMRIVDVAWFDAEHDDYHLARIRELVRGCSAR